MLTQTHTYTRTHSPERGQGLLVAPQAAQDGAAAVVRGGVIRPQPAEKGWSEEERGRGATGSDAGVL